MDYKKSILKDEVANILICVDMTQRSVKTFHWLRVRQTSILEITQFCWQGQSWASLANQQRSPHTFVC